MALNVTAKEVSVHAHRGWCGLCGFWRVRIQQSLLQEVYEDPKIIFTKSQDNLYLWIISQKSDATGIENSFWSMLLTALLFQRSPLYTIRSSLILR